MGNTWGPDKGSESVAPSGGSSNGNDTVTWGSRPRLCICRRSAASLQGLNTGCIYAALFHIRFRRVLPFGLSSRPRTRRVRAEGSVRSVLDRDAALPTDSSTHLRLRLRLRRHKSLTRDDRILGMPFAPGFSVAPSRGFSFFLTQVPGAHAPGYVSFAAPRLGIA